MTDWSTVGAPAPSPTKTPAQKDSSSAPWGDVLGQAATKFLPSYAHDTVEGIKNLAKGATSAFKEDVLGQSSPQASVAPQYVGHPLHAMADAAKTYVQQSYTNPGAFKHTLMTDPARPAMDAQAVLSTLGGGEGLAARLPGLAGDIGSSVARGATAVAKATNPVFLAGAGVAGVAKASQRALRGGSALDATGNFTPKAMSAIQSAFPNGELDDATLQHGPFKQALVQTMQTKGVTPAAVREAVLVHNGAPLSRAVASQAASRAPGLTQDATSAGKVALGQKAQALAGGPPDSSGVAAALEAAHDRSLAAINQNYETLRNQPGSFGAAMDPAVLGQNIQTNLQQAGIPATPELLSRSGGAYPQANEALGLVSDSLVNGKTRLGGDVNAPELMEVRRQLTGLRQGARGSDIKAVNAIIDGFHQTVEDEAQAGNFRLPDGTSNTTIGPDLQAANAAYRDHFNQFDNTQGPLGPIARAVRSLKGAANSGLADDADAQMAVQKTLGQRLLNPKDGPVLYTGLSNILGPDGMAPVNDFIRQNVLGTNEAGALQTKPSDMRSFLDGPMGDRVFTPDEQADTRLLAAGSDVLNAKLPSAPGGNAIGQAAARLGRLTVGAGAGFLGGHYIPGIGEPLGTVAGAMAEQVAEPINTLRKASQEQAGVGAKGSILGGPSALGDAAAAVAPVAPLVADRKDEQESAPAPAAQAATGPTDAEPQDWEDIGAPVAPDDQGHATGGRVHLATGGKAARQTHEQLVERLMKMARAAKIKSNKVTEPLLNVPDNAVVKALGIAQQAI